MIGQAISEQFYNLIILAGGQASRMASGQFLPKVLLPLGNIRVLDWILHHHDLVADRVIFGLGVYGDLVESYAKSRYPKKKIFFEYDGDLKNTAASLMNCLDSADHRLPTIVTFCDLLIMSPSKIISNSIWVANNKTFGNVGSFRHTLEDGNILKHESPVEVSDGHSGILGYFVFQNTRKLKSIVYDSNSLTDITDDVVIKYFSSEQKNISTVEKVVEFGTENDLQRVRALWEKV